MNEKTGENNAYDTVIHARRVTLSGGREVAVGHIGGMDDCFLHFVNAEGEATNLRLSTDGAAALYALLHDPEAGEAYEVPVAVSVDVPGTMRWVAKLSDGGEWSVVGQPSDTTDHD